MAPKIPLRPLLLATAAALALTACFDGGDDEVAAAADDPGQVPASATASPEAFSAYAAGLAASDSAEPLLLTGLVPPVSETDEPIVVMR